MKRKILSLLVIIIMVILSGCSKEYSRDITKNTIKQIVKDVYTPKTMKQMRESYTEYGGAFLTQEAADSFYVARGEELTEDDLKRTCYVDVLYSSKENNSEGKSHYLAKMQLYGAHGELTTADIFFYVKDDINEDKETIIDRILVANVVREK